MIVGSKNIDLGKTQITDLIRVSSAAIYYEEMFGSFYQIETWIFSDDERVKSRMFIHCTPPPRLEYVESKRWLVNNFHRRVANLLRKELNVNNKTNN